jgi:hypothetical protein
MILTDESGYKYQVVKAELEQYEYHLLDCNSFYALVIFGNNPKSLSFKYEGNRIVATTNQKLIKLGCPRLPIKDGGCIGFYYTEIEVNNPKPILDTSRI